MLPSNMLLPGSNLSSNLSSNAQLVRIGFN